MGGKVSVDSNLSARYGRVKARRLASVIGTVLLMHLSWSPVTKLYTRHLYALINPVVSLNCRVVLKMEPVDEPTLWQELQRLSFEGAIWPLTRGLLASVPLAAVCPVRLLRELDIFTGGSEDQHIFCGFNGRLVAKSPRNTAPGPFKNLL